MLSANQSFQRDVLSSQAMVGDNQQQPSTFQLQQGSVSTLSQIPEVQKHSEGDVNSQVLNNPQSLVFDGVQEKVPFYRKKKFLIICGLAIAISFILVGVLTYVFTAKQFDQSGSPTIPKTFSQYESKIMAGQENNLIKIINVPKSLRVYEYKLTNLQKTSSGEQQESNSISTTQHKLGLVCVNVTEASFDMILYFMESSFVESNTNKNSTLSGYPKIKNQQPKRRFLKNQLELNEQDFFELSETVHTEFDTLTETEVKILAQKNITENDYYLSNLPIIRFTMTKNGEISFIEQPVNLRYDLHSIFLNVLQQMSPVVMKDFYNIYENDKNNGKRVLSASKNQYKFRILSNEEVQPSMEAEIKSETKGNLEKSYSKVENKENQGLELLSYSQKSILTNGALQQSQVKSNFDMIDNSEQNESSIPIMKSIGMNSNCTISYLYQEDEMNQKQLEELINDQEEMAVLKISWSEAFDLYNKVFNKSYQNNLSSDKNEEQNRMLQDAKVMGKTVTKPIFRQNYASIDFGADIKSECTEGNLISADDICTVGLYSFFNGESMKVAEKQAKVNISKILKYYQYIQHMISDKLGVVKGKVQTHIDTINKSLGDIMVKVEQMLDVQQNPVLKDIYNVVYNDELKIINQINQVELFINTAIKNVNKIAEDPLTTLKTRTMNFLLKKQIDIREQVENIEKFYKAQFKRILDYIISVKNNGISDKVYAKLKSALEHYDGVIIELIEVPVKKMLDQVETAILEQAEKAYKNAIEVDQQVSTNSTSVAKNATETVAPNKIKQILTTVGLSQNLTEIVAVSVRQILNQTAVHDALKNGIKQSLDLTKSDVLKQLDSLKRNNTVEANKEVDEIIEDIEGVIDYSVNLYNDLKEVKEDIVEIVNALKKLQGQDMKKLIIDLTANLTDFPIGLAVQIKDSAVATVQKIKQIGVNMKTNLVSWKDELVKNSKTLLDEVKVLYKDIVEFLQLKTFPTDDPKFYEKPLFDDISSLTQNVKDLMNTKFTGLTDSYNRLVQIPTKFKKFISDIQALGKRTVAYFGEIKIAVTSMNIDGGLIWQYIQKRIQGERTNADTSINNSINTEVVEQVEKQAITPLNDQVNQIMKTDMVTYQQQVDVQQTSMSQIYKDTIKAVIAAAEFSKNFTFDPLSFPLEYVYFYPTPIGVAIKVKLSAKWDAGFNLNVNFKNATLDLSAGATTKVTVGGEISASIVIAEVGGYAEGTFLETGITTGIKLQVLNNYKGSFYIDGSFKPYSVKIGLYYMHYFPTEIVKCGSVPQPTQDEVSGQIVVNKNVQTVSQSILGSIFSKIKKAIECLTQIKITPKKNDIFPPFQVSGQTYQKRLFEETF